MSDVPVNFLVSENDYWCEEQQDFFKKGVNRSVHCDAVLRIPRKEMKELTHLLARYCAVTGLVFYLEGYDVWYLTEDECKELDRVAKYFAGIHNELHEKLGLSYI